MVGKTSREADSIVRVAYLQPMAWTVIEKGDGWSINSFLWWKAFCYPPVDQRNWVINHTSEQW